MTTEEKLDMFREKDSFIRRLDLALTTPVPRGMSVYGVEYEVYQNGTSFYEFIVIQFKGGAFVPIPVSGNSNAANFQVVAENINGGDYSSLQFYHEIQDKSTKLSFD